MIALLKCRKQISAEKYREENSKKRKETCYVDEDNKEILKNPNLSESLKLLFRF